MSPAFLTSLYGLTRHLFLGGAFACACTAAMAGPIPPAKPAGFAEASIARSAAARTVAQPLSTADADRYRRIFRYQRDGRWADADRLIRQLDSNLLLGHVRFQRLMHPTRYRASYDELEHWLARYADHPGAYRIFALAMKRQPEGAESPKLPVHGKEHLRQFLGERQNISPSAAATERSLAAPIRKLVSKGKLSEAEAAIKVSPLGVGPSDRLRAKVAFGYILRGDPKSALRLASWAANRSRSQTSLPDWVAGLAAFQLGQFEAAAFYFGKHSASPHAGEWNVAAGAYWAARSWAELGKHNEAKRWLYVGAQYRFTFYGQVARAKLGLTKSGRWLSVRASDAELRSIKALAGGKRAMALVQAGEIRRADEELLQYLGDAGSKQTRKIVNVAAELGLPQTAVRGSFRLSTGFNQQPPESALYPQPEWQPSEGMTVDAALIWAFVRQESLFNPRATSSAGARGLMQLMPRTANYIAGEKRFSGSSRDYLYEPPMNLALGQRYLRYLMRKGHVGQDLFRLMTAYNAGVGNLKRWEKSGRLSRDPLMFIETLPLLETRLFVERVMANLWAYRQRMGQPTPSLDHLVNGRWPQYVAIDTSGVELARKQTGAD